MEGYSIRVKLKDGKVVETPKTSGASIDKLIKVIKELSLKDEDFRFTDSEKQFTVKARDIVSVEAVF